MFRKFSLFLLIFSFLVSAVPAQKRLDYPKPKKIEQVDNYHGTAVSDPYRWMEDAPLNDDTKAWIESQNQLTDAYFATIPEREHIRSRLTELWNYERYSASSISDPGKVFFDPNKLTADGTAALNGSSFTDDGKLWAYGIAKSGSDRTE